MAVATPVGFAYFVIPTRGTHEHGRSAASSCCLGLVTRGSQVAVGVMRVVLSFEVKQLPDTVDEAFTDPVRNGSAGRVNPRPDRVAPSTS